MRTLENFVNESRQKTSTNRLSALYYKNFDSRSQHMFDVICRRLLETYDDLHIVKMDVGNADIDVRIRAMQEYKSKYKGVPVLQIIAVKDKLIGIVERDSAGNYRPNSGIFADTKHDAADDNEITEAARSESYKYGKDATDVITIPLK